MDQHNVARRKRELSKQQAMYVAKRETGADREQSAIFAGYPMGQDAGKQVEESPVVQAELAKARAELVKTSGITKDDVLEGLKDAAAMAKLMADPQAMVRAWSEIGKMLGFYAPEVKKHLHGLDEETKDALRNMTDEQLLKISRGRVIEGEKPVLIEEEKE